MIVELAAAAAIGGAEAPEPKLCDPKKYVSHVDPDMRYTEEEFNPDTFRWALDWFKSEDWKKQIEGKTYDRPLELGWEFEMAYRNRLTIFEGYVLKLRALSAKENERDAAVDQFCKFVIKAVPLD